MAIEKNDACTMPRHKDCKSLTTIDIRAISCKEKIFENKHIHVKRTLLLIIATTPS